MNRVVVPKKIQAGLEVDQNLRRDECSQAELSSRGTLDQKPWPEVKRRERHDREAQRATADRRSIQP
jgi:hypothetical protein